MRVAALISRERIPTVSGMLEAPYELCAYGSLGDLVAGIHQAPHGAALIEAGLVRQPASIRNFSNLAQTWPALIFAVPADMELLFCDTSIARSSLSRIVAADGPSVLLDVRRYLDSRRRDNLRATVLATLEPKVVCLAPALQSAARDLIDRGYLPRSATDLAHRFGIHPRTADRSMHSSGLGSTHRLIVMAQVLRAYELLQHPELTLIRVAAHVGFTSARPLTRLVHTVTGDDIRNLQTATDFNRLVPAFLNYLSETPRYCS